jgi:hypothetical protein
MSVVVALFIGLTVSAEEIIRDRKILKRESFLNLSRSSYLWSKILIMFVLSAIQTLTFVLVGNLLLGVKGMFTDYWLVLFTTSCFANLLGLNISSAFNSAVTIYILIPFLIIPQLLLSGVIVKFDKLNPSITSQETVPVAGEMMASRWAFEALAVNQFRNNQWQRQFNYSDELTSIADYKNNYWLPQLRGKIDKCETAATGNNKGPDFATDVQVVKNEIATDLVRIRELSKRGKISKLTIQLSTELDRLSQNVSKVNPATFSKVQADDMRNYLNMVNSVYKTIYQKAVDQHDKQVNKLEKELTSVGVMKLKNDYLNESLSDLVRNSNEFNKLIEKDGKLIQRSDPIFSEAWQTNLGNAHFFAPRKKLFGTYIDTFWYNLIVLWGMTALMIITLYFDLLRKLIEGLGNLSERFLRRNDND